MNLKELLTHISATTLLLVFLFFCGTLYIISYWSTFNFDITNYIELFDIPKSFVFPLATGLGVSLLSLLAQGIMNASTDTDEPRPLVPKLPKQAALIRKLRWIDSNFMTLVVVLACMLLYRDQREWIVILLGLTLCLWSFIKLNKSNRIIKVIPDKRLRLIFTVLITFIPIYSFCKGKLDAIAVWKNRNYYTVENIVYSDSSTLSKQIVGKKLLGKLGATIIVTDSANSNIVVVSLNNVEIVQYKQMRSRNLLEQ